ncbi:hypothetical protein AVEN_157327-1 [Araneus ventricosus]|uniref:Uncharacterized protein n=1 Tax=Araneus ventricosus TaxID=182803 RepID=A0A4Y2SH68_ARAVE|nr:hypothetical protein AVEN_157327-1 [Araneus ventricosus]
MHICLIALNKSALAGNEAHLSGMLKMVSFSNNTHLHMGLHFPLHIVQHGSDTLAQASVIRFRSSCNVGGEVAYTRCVVYTTEKSPVFSGQVNVEAILRNHHTR